MNFPRFWALGRHANVTCWRWSDVSLSEAEGAANEAARRLAERFTRGERLTRHYGYADRPLRESVLRELKNGAGEVAGVVTRNAYGSLVLNTARVMFVDVDLPEPKPAGGFFKRLFGGPQIPSADPAENDALAKAERWVHGHAGWGWRIYRTRAGLRLLATHDVFEPETAASNGVFDAVGADPLYRQLCKVQKCFRARLTPKYWRCDGSRPPARWPFENEKAEKRFQKWQVEYDRLSASFATCEFIRQSGDRTLHPEVQLILEVHDEATRVASKLALA
jgi:hypothetical protein